MEANVDQHCVSQESQDPRKPGGRVGDEDAQDVLVTSCKEEKEAFDVGHLIHSKALYSVGLEYGKG